MQRFFVGVVSLLTVTIFGFAGCGSAEEVIVETQTKSVEDNSDQRHESDAETDDYDGSIRHDDNEPDSYNSGLVVISQR